MTRHELAGRAAVVTGAGSGIGRAVSQRLARAGAALVCADVVAESAATTAASIEQEGGTATAMAADVSDPAEVTALVEAATDRHGSLDVMCNVAGIGGRSRVVDTTEEELDRMLAVTVKGAYFGCQAAARAMCGQGSGSIVNVASTAIDVPTEGLAPYTLAKAAVASLTKVLAAEVGPAGVRVNAVAPGFVPTPLSMGGASPETADSRARAFAEEMAARAPLRRTATTEEIAEVFLFLASDASSFVTGQTIRPNGGASMPW